MVWTILLTLSYFRRTWKHYSSSHEAVFVKLLHLRPVHSTLLINSELMLWYTWYKKCPRSSGILYLFKSILKVVAIHERFILVGLFYSSLSMMHFGSQPSLPSHHSPGKTVVEKKWAWFIPQQKRVIQQRKRKCRKQPFSFVYWNCTSAWVFSCKFAAYFQKTF